MIKWLVIIIIFIALLISGINWFLTPDNLLNCSGVPTDVKGCAKADAIIAVSGGDTTARTQEAIDMYNNGWADELIFSGAAFDKSGPSNAAVMRDMALEQGVPRSAITIEETSENTAENAENTSGILNSQDYKSVIVVTSAYHMKRTVLEFSQRAPDIDFRGSPVSTDKQWSIWWWTTPYGWYLAVSETFKIIVVSTG